MASMTLHERSTPMPFVVEPSGKWMGNDGNWSTFAIEIGTPPQTFHVLPSTSCGEVWVPAPEGCEWSPFPDQCGSSRGVGLLNNTQSIGFQLNTSSTWDLLGTYQLATAQNLFADDANATYGLDTVSFGSDASDRLQNQTIAGIATPDYWLGDFGLGIVSAQFDVQSSDIPSLLSSMKAQNMTPSLSYGYTAGASYLSSLASLTLGGYDQSRVSPASLEMDVDTSNGQNLKVALRSIVIANGLDGTVSMPGATQDLNVTLDSSVSMLWLPQAVCDQFVQAFGLIYDPATELFLVNNSMHNTLIHNQPQVTLILAPNTTSTTTTNIVLPYAAFDLQAGTPFYNGTQPYFPIRNTTDPSKYTLGRVFFQEAYVTVDWERNNFTIGQAVHDSTATKIVPILPPTTANQAKSHFLQPGVIAGIAVAVGLVALVLGMAAIFFRRHRQKAHRPEPIDSGSDEHLEDVKVQPDELTELHGEHRPPELLSAEFYELQDDYVKHQLMSSEVYELNGRWEAELECPLPRTETEITRNNPP